MPPYSPHPRSLVDITVEGPEPYQSRIFPLSVQFLDGEWKMQVIPAQPSTDPTFCFAIKDLKVWAPAGHL